MPLIVISLCFLSVWLLFSWVCISLCFHVTYTHLPTCGSAGPRGSRHSLGHPQHSCFPGQSLSLSQLASELNGQLSVSGLLPGHPPSVASCAKQPVNKKWYQCTVEYFISEVCVSLLREGWETGNLQSGKATENMNKKIQEQFKSLNIVTQKFVVGVFRRNDSISVAILASSAFW